MIRLGDRGSAAAEFAVALPAVAIVLALGAGALAAGSVSVRLQDAAADAARLAARGEPTGRVTAAVTEAVPGAHAAITHRDDLVCVTAMRTTSVALLELPPLAATSCALAGGL